MGVRIVRDGAAANSEADYVHVSAWCDPDQDTVTLATIQRVVHKRQDDERSPGARHVKTLISKQPMPADYALVLAQSYAERKQIGLVLSDIHVGPLELAEQAAEDD